MKMDWDSTNTLRDRGLTRSFLGGDQEASSANTITTLTFSVSDSENSLLQARLKCALAVVQIHAPRLMYSSCRLIRMSPASSCSPPPFPGLPPTIGNPRQEIS